MELSVAMIKSLAEPDPDNASANEVYDTLVVLSESVSDGGIDKIPAPNYGAIMGGIQALHLTYQSLREVRDYQTPKGLRHFATFLIVTTPVLLAPFWASFCGPEGEDGLWDDWNGPYGCFPGYFMAALYVIITFSLLRVQEALEDPFDGTGEDDIQWKVFARNLEAIHLHGLNGSELRAQAKASESAGYQAADAKKD